jgi:dTDP-4-amino-4,6-dideoxygalactose transaminase
MIYFENLRDINESFFDDYLHNFGNVLNAGSFILGGYVNRFEESFAKYLGIKHCIGVGSGFDALVLSLKSFGFEKNSEVIIPSNCHIATVNAVILAGLKPILVEPDIFTYNIDSSKIEAKINSSTKSIVAVHLYGKTCNMDSIIELTKKYNLKLIEDCSYAHGAKYKNKMAGTFGDLGTFNFNPSAILGALGDGGAVVTNDDHLAMKIKALRNCGTFDNINFEFVGFNSRLDEVQACFLTAKLRRLDEIIEHNRMLANLYSTFLKNDFIKPIVDDDYFDVYQIFNIRHERRNELKEYLHKNGIQAKINFLIPPHKQKAMEGIIQEKEFPISEEIHNTNLSLPISFAHTEKEIFKVIEVINKF